MSEIGYGKPPQHTRFKKGTSGNPKGRSRRDQEDWGTIVQSILSQKVKALINGEPLPITRREAIVRQLANKATAGNLAAFKAITAMEKQDDKSNSDETEPLTVIVRRFFPEDEENS